MTISLLNAVGVICQIVGVVIAVVGLWKTWREFAGGEPFMRPYQDRTTAILRTIKARGVATLNRLFRRHPETLAYAGVAGGVSTMSSAVRARVTWGPLPLDTAAALEELHRRTLDLSKTQADATDRHADALASLRDDLDRLTAHVDDVIAHFDALAGRVAVGGIRWQASGLFLVLLGLALQGIAAAISQ